MLLHPILPSFHPNPFFLVSQPFRIHQQRRIGHVGRRVVAARPAIRARVVGLGPPRSVKHRPRFARPSDGLSRQGQVDASGWVRCRVWVDDWWFKLISHGKWESSCCNHVTKNPGPLPSKIVNISMSLFVPRNVQDFHDDFHHDTNNNNVDDTN